MKKLLILVIALLGLSFLGGETLYAQCVDPGDPDDAGNRDTLWIEQENGRIQPNTTVIRTIKCYWDEEMAAGSVPIKYRNPQTNVFLDSIKLTDHNTCCGITTDKVIDTAAGTVLVFWLGLTGGFMPPGTYTMATMYFRTGASWDPAIPNPLDTFNPGQGLSFVDTATNDITPIYCPPGDLEVKFDPGHGVGLPKTFSLSQNFPNPFNANTVIAFALPKTGHVKLEIYNILGQKVKDLVDEMVTAGYKRVVWDGKDNSGTDVASGVYFYRIKTQETVEVMKMTLLK